MTNVNYRSYESKDIPQLVELGIRLHEELTNKKTELQKSFLESAADFFQSGLDHQNYICWVAEIDSNIVSVGGICIYTTPPISLNIQNKVGFLTHFYTCPEFRRHGYSKNVLKNLISQSQELKLNRLHMGTTEKGFGLYTNAGFKEPSYKQLVLHLTH